MSRKHGGEHSIGLAAERFTHEFARLTREAYPILERLQAAVKGKQSDVAADIAALRAIVDALTNDIKTLGPMFYVRRSTAEKDLSVLSAVENAKTLNEGTFQNVGVLSRGSSCSPRQGSMGRRG